MINVQHWGSGPSVVLVHGAVTNGEMTWARQRPLGDRWHVIVPDRRGYYPNPPAAVEDYEVDADDVAVLLGDGAHLVGHCYGGLVALLAAAARPDAVRSLTLIEPGVTSVVRGHPELERKARRWSDLWDNPPNDAEAFLAAFFERLGGPVPSFPSPLPPPLEQNVKLLMHQRSPNDAAIPFDALRAAPFGKLVISGGHDTVFELICDAVTDSLGPDTERATITGAGHAVPRTGEVFNTRLEEFLRRAE